MQQGDPLATTPDEDVVHPAAGSADTAKKLARWRRTVGLVMLGLVVFLWTASNFLGSAILADDTSFNKPFFLTYLNTSFFVLPLVPALWHRIRRNPEEVREWWEGCRAWVRNPIRSMRKGDYRSLQPSSPLATAHHRSMSDSQELLLSDPRAATSNPKTYEGEEDREEEPALTHLTLSQTARLGLEFCILWFLANYLVAVSLEYTTVASSTILTSTSSVFTLVFGVLFKVELFTWRKLLGILASLSGIILVSSVDLSGTSGDAEHRGDFPEKTPRELFIGNALAFLSAGTYGVYTVFMKKRIDDESKINMPLFFGFVGLANVLLLWPGFFLLHFIGLETFELPHDKTVLAIILTNCVASLLADMAWAYAVLLTTPIVVTVGLSLTIPLSLVGQMVLNAQTATAIYWVGAVVVVASFVFVNHEEKKEEEVVVHQQVLQRGASVEIVVDALSGFLLLPIFHVGGVAGFFFGGGEEVRESFAGGAEEAFGFAFGGHDGEGER
ncbi:uncharacterized protein LTR77_007454 [Saxophila tyrrhenica]|uniref:EamA domain-containing protein n=1 Tax=Saxophila tyrrhenica TaxID=1690608 RepID=A0AAV9P8V3_9PEZI|nr:hypothetical protein LTR77_007454 [Saxophila tyrrhenica]